MRRYRVAAGLTQEALAGRAGLSARGIADLERGARRAPHPDTLRRLTSALDLADADRARLVAAGGRSPATGAWQVQVQLTSFVGRDRELADVLLLLERSRLITMTGPPGVGKTRLALEVAQRVAHLYADGAVLVELAAIVDGDLAPHAVASALGVREHPDEKVLRALTVALRPKSLVLVLDNCEHLVPACAELADVLIRTCPNLRLLCTSRESLHVDGETVWQVQGLVLGDAARLFAERARSVQPDFATTDANAEAVNEICIRLDGLALAIELAAARVAVLDPEQIAARLQQHPRLLSRASRTTPPRHAALRAAIDWSYELLSDTEKTLLQRLSVFASGWSIEAAEDVTSDAGIDRTDILDLLHRLVDKYLVVAKPGVGGGVRFRLLEVIRLYAAERLRRSGNSAAVATRHQSWCLRLAMQALDDYWWRTNLLTCLASLDRETDNMRAAMRFSLEIVKQDGARKAHNRNHQQS